MTPHHIKTVLSIPSPISVQGAEGKWPGIAPAPPPSLRPSSAPAGKEGEDGIVEPGTLSTEIRFPGTAAGSWSKLHC